MPDEIGAVENQKEPRYSDTRDQIKDHLASTSRARSYRHVESFGCQDDPGASAWGDHLDILLE